MTTIDTISDVITRIRNANILKLDRVELINTKVAIGICHILKDRGFINSFGEFLNSSDRMSNRRFIQKYIIVNLKYKGERRSPCIKELRRISKPGRRVYVGYKNLHKTKGGIELFVLSTSKGLITDYTAREKGIGGELLFSIC
uniref:Small ribosomal subunit protein uS8c n=1 Tax=Euglena longa TaxID=3037 RepID=RR8_EUGLO|nr:ribosomal protein S8 [Euglena longa]P24353.1 RecName: Full=Small ribosomal subunit protein uS8c; AltName: Full=30S ribosomal protein S8, plastid [Euglena longa]CAC24577.1 ribosomal protein S8 [Euglena longa]